ncbi:universal stress protein [Propionivibrio limicola]|uniref:universal stress protein n=1 Tax=Propionivibrio limicola TaxID=167645 RepID=UPI0012914620|nr:universal stress protein [Propionivibrio limicola]
MFKHVLVPTDGSPLSEAAVRAAVSFAKEAGAAITAVHVMKEYPESYASEGLVFDATGRFAQLAEEEAQEILGFVERLCTEAGVACTKVVHAPGAVYEAIIATAAENGCDLIFMASHGRHGVHALLLGSETTKVLTHSKVPVLVYR